MQGEMLHGSEIKPKHVEQTLKNFFENVDA